MLFTNRVVTALDEAIAQTAPDRMFVLADENTARACLPLLAGSVALKQAQVIVIPADDVNKTLATVADVWQRLTDGGATRHSLLVNIGGGMVTDLGGFAAATFKRGIRFINVPTTLLAAVDASVGGKTGINFAGLKNEIGVFRDADQVIISSIFFKTLPVEQLLSGYAEMVKHALLTGSSALGDILRYDIAADGDADRLLALVEDSVAVKAAVVADDPLEKGRRAILNLGHTVGHAFESLAMERGKPIPHGYAVAYGIVAELVAAHLLVGFPSDRLHTLAAYVRELYGRYPVDCDDYPRLLELMSHDKKNARSAGAESLVTMVLLTDVGQPQVRRDVTAATITAALDIYREI